MLLLHNISRNKTGRRYCTPDDVLSCNQPISFDSVHYNVYLNQGVLENKDVTLFVTGDFVGLDNSFDEGQTLERLCDWNQIMDLVTIYGCKLGWNTWSYRDLTTLSDKEIIYEVQPPFPMRYFAYPFGKYDDRVLEIVKAMGYEKAYSIIDTDGTDFTIPRKRLY